MNVLRAKRFWITALLLAGYAPGLTSHWYEPLLRSGSGPYWVIEITTWVLLPGFILWTGLRLGLFNTRQLGLHLRFFSRPVSISSCLKVLGLICLWLPFNLWLNQLSQTWLSTRMVSGGPWIETSFLEFRHFLKFAYLAISAGVVEEFYGRSVLGCLFHRTPLHIILYVSVSAIVFALIHWEGGPGYLSFTFVWGLIFGLAYVWLRSVWPLMAAHTLYDLLAYLGVTIP